MGSFLSWVAPLEPDGRFRRALTERRGVVAWQQYGRFDGATGECPRYSSWRAQRFGTSGSAAFLAGIDSETGDLIFVVHAARTAL